jgi:transposase-like protein
MTKPIARDPIYRRRRFDREIIELCVRWYVTYRLSYRDLVAIMAERGVPVSHTTILRWVVHFVPEFERRWNRRARPIHSSWRVDETYICIRGRWNDLYRAVDKFGKTVDFLLRPNRRMADAQAFFRKALSRGWPRRITLDGHTASHMALRLLCRENHKWRRVLPSKLSLPEQDRRAGPPSDQTALCADDGIQVVSKCPHHARRHRARPSDPEGPVCLRPGPPPPDLVP